MWVIFWRELKSYFDSSVAYIFMGFFLLVAGAFFAVNNILGANPDFKTVLGSLLFIFLFIVPILTMRLLSEDRRSKTDQMLITSPIGIVGIVLGKYLAALGVFLITIAITFAYPLIMSFHVVDSLAFAEIVGGYLGFFLLGASFIAIGLFISSLTENPVVAALATFGALLVTWVLDWVQPGLPKDQLSGLVFIAVATLGLFLLVHSVLRSAPITILLVILAIAGIVASYLLISDWYKGVIVRAVGWFSPIRRFQDFGLGVLSLSPIAYYLSFSAVFVFLTIRVIEKRRWS